MHVDFLSLLIENAACFKHAYVPLKDQGLVHVRGVNLDEGGSNGSGKTSLFEMLFYLFYDKLTKSERKVKKDELINVYSPSNFLLHAEIMREDVPYTVEKYRKVKKRGSGVDVWKSGDLVTPDDPREAQKMLAGLLGRSWNEILGSVYLSQRHTHKMLEGTPAEKKEYMSRYFGLDSLDSMITSSEKRLKAVPLPDETHLRSLLDGVESDLSSLGDLSALDSSYESLVQRRDSVQRKLIETKTGLEKQEEAKQIQKEHKRWKKFLSSNYGISTDREEIKALLVESRESCSTLKDSIRNARKRAELLEEVSSLGGVVGEDLGDTLEDLRSSVSRLERLIPGVEKRQRLERKLDSIGEDEELSRAKLRKRKEKWSTRRSELSGKVASVVSELRKIRSVGDSCHTCLRPISPEEKAEMVQVREDNLSSLRSSCAKAEEALQAYSSRLADVEARVALLAQLEGLPDGDFKALQAELRQAQEEYKKVREDQSKLVRLGVLTEKLSDLPEPTYSIEELTDKLDAAESAVEYLDDAYQWVLQSGNVIFDVYEYQSLTSAVATHQSDLEAINDDLLAVQESRAQGKALLKQQKDINKTLSASSREKTKSQVLRYITITLGELKKKGLRESTKLLSGVLPIYLDQLFPKGDIELSETDDENGFDLVFNKGGKTLPLTLISGGQAKRVGLAIVFAFAKMGRNTTNLLICDEPFRDLDKNGREACFEVLRDFDIGTLLVTSHDQDLSASRKYDQVWTVQMKNQISTLYLDG